MIFVISEEAQVLSTLASTLRTHVSGSVVAVDNGFVASRLMEFNPADVLVVDLSHIETTWLRALPERYPHLVFLGVATTADEVADKRTLLPDPARFAPHPLQFDELVAHLRHFTAAPMLEEAGITAIGLEDVLTLLALTKACTEVVVTAGTKVGRMVVHDGIVVHAERDGRVGEEVALEMAGWAAARVATRRVSGRLAVPIMDLSIHALLHEAARRSDEIDRLRDRPDVQRVLEELRQLQGFRGAVLAHVDNGCAVVTSTGERESAAGEALRAAIAAARAWAAEATPSEGGPTQCTFSWNEHHVVGVLRVNAQFALCVMGEDLQGAAELRRAAQRAAASLQTLIDQSFAASMAHVANAMPW